MNSRNGLKSLSHRQAARNDLPFGKMFMFTHGDLSVLNQGEKEARAGSRFLS